ncbi:E3 ubiquitin ligase [Emiliania huxleyi CCMP1516]|uniref:RCC1-like domain-containing protein n=2 Tax=Emiliania huxleyi TaxID=2903 RepID=A0A0D3K142_EMIH1|nr:E3 ubiquitin ligase [Emiliania huxleyi CCMP1516]EOD29477.1 E3 ubiquitin ligase [Emiliania huxleyi CCMP1516]|eukprot:XP_005781906.1 E3 ubiquitin ligase [Emiliania huxleyi CCMP1516]
MSRRAARRLAAAASAPSPSTPPPARLLDLPTDLLARVVSRCDFPVDNARVAAVSHLFHASLAKEGIRLWAQERGFELPAQPEGETCAVRWLCYSALLREANPPARAAAGESHSVFIDGVGRLSSCGSGAVYPGLLGHGEGVTRVNTPTRLPLLGERAVSVSAGSAHSLSLTAGGAAWSWGIGGGYLGHGDEQNQWQPKEVEAFAGRRVVAVSAGSDHSLALTTDGRVWSWGYGRDGRLGHGDEQRQLLPKRVEAFAGQRVIVVTAGAYHSLALTADGSVWSWGEGASGKLGHGDQQRQLLPKKVEAFAGQRVVAVSAGTYHSLAITADSAVWSWGEGNSGQLGHGDQQRQLLPKKIEAFAGQRVVTVSAGVYHSLAIAADGAVWSWGEGSYGRLGHGNEQRQLPPKKIEAFIGQHVVAVSAGAYHSLAITADGAVFTWGEGEDGCLGHGEDLSNQLLPKKVEAWAEELRRE